MSLACIVCLFRGSHSMLTVVIMIVVSPVGYWRGNFREQLQSAALWVHGHCRPQEAGPQHLAGLYRSIGTLGHHDNTHTTMSPWQHTQMSPWQHTHHDVTMTSPWQHTLLCMPQLPIHVQWSNFQAYPCTSIIIIAAALASLCTAQKIKDKKQRADNSAGFVQHLQLQWRQTE